MKIKVSEASGEVLDWLVAKADQPVYSDKALIRALTAGYDGIGNKWDAFNPSTNWSQGGPIIEREHVEVTRGGAYSEHFWKARRNSSEAFGPTPLVAAMRCYVSSKLGEEVDVPEELI